ncbi:MAG: glycosyltransferase [Bacilli bacterium]|nr:glycosyltransferase [Bacilli bacterium]
MKYTVIVVNYNKGKYIKKCLDSIMNQTNNSFNVIIVDDGSTDNSRSIINMYKKYNNVSVYFKKNTGVSDSRNFAINKVKTQYFLFVDSDDYVVENLLEECSKYTDFDVLSFNNYLVSNKGKVEKDIPKPELVCTNGEFVLKKFIDNKCLFLVPWGYIYKTSFFRKNKLKYKVGYVHEDVDLTTMALLKSSKTLSIDFYGYYYVLSDDSIMRNSNYEKMQLRVRSILYHFDNLKEYFINNIDDNNLRDSFLEYYSQLLLYTGHDLKRRWRKAYSKELKKRKIYKYMYKRSKINYIKRLMCKHSFMLYFDIYPIFSKVYYFLANIYYFIRRLCGVDNEKSK